MKRQLAILLLALVCRLVIFFQTNQPPRYILIPWRIMYTMHSHGSRLLGTFTMTQQWSATWKCTSSFSPWILQIDDRQGHALQETVPCDGNERRGRIHEPGMFYLAVTTEGEWMLQIEESPLEYEVGIPWGCDTGYVVCIARTGRVRS